MSFSIVLVEPEIPPNTGNIARTCAATGTSLHLIKPLGFDIGEKNVRRAGLDYWPFVDLHVYESYNEFAEKNKNATMYYITKFGKHYHTDFDYEEGAMFLFGRETKGLPKKLLRDNENKTVRIPMLPGKRLRSLNLANSANIILYEALRQTGFQGLV